MDKYPRTIKLDNPKLKKLLAEKGELILEGREKSDEIELIEIEMKQTEEEIIAIEKTVDVKDIEEEAKNLTYNLNELVAKMDDLKKQVYDRAKKVVPKELTKKYETLEKNKEILETERNKLALKAQQKMDKIIPLGQKAMKEHLADKYEDYDSLRLENGEVVGTIFSHLNDFEKTFEKKFAKK